MKFSSKLGMFVVIVAVGVVPAVALAGHGHGGPPSGTPHAGSGPSGPTGPTGPTGPGGHGKSHGHGNSHKCKPHKVAFIAGGTVASSSLTLGTKGLYSGSLMVNVTRSNHHAAGTDGKFTLVSTRVKFDGGTSNPPAVGDRVQVIGWITQVAKSCPDQSGAGPVTLRLVVIHPPKGPPGPTGPAGPTGPTGPTGPSGPTGPTGP